MIRRTALSSCFWLIVKMSCRSQRKTSVRSVVLAYDNDMPQHVQRICRIILYRQLVDSHWHVPGSSSVGLRASADLPARSERSSLSAAIWPPLGSAGHALRWHQRNCCWPRL